MKDSDTLNALDEAIQNHHNTVRFDGEPAMIVGWAVSYIAVDGNGSELMSYATGQGTTTATAVGLCEWTKNIILNGEPSEEGDDE